jgi:hypothetical protein
VFEISRRIVAAEALAKLSFHAMEIGIRWNPDRRCEHAVIWIEQLEPLAWPAKRHQVSAETSAHKRIGDLRAEDGKDACGAWQRLISRKSVVSDQRSQAVSDDHII